MAATNNKIGTHDGSFHCDEALACFLLQQTSEFKDAEIVRSRDPAVLDALPIVVDVGAVYDPARHRYDHHQRGFAETLSPAHTMKLSSAGLVYKHFGREVIRALQPSLGDADLETVYQKVYTSFVEALDGIDNGISQYPADVQPLYKSRTDLSSRVGRLNPEWNEEGEVDINARFLQAVALTGKEFSDEVRFFVRSWLPARNIVKEALGKRFEVHPSGQIVRLDTFTLWKTHLLELEEELQLPAPILYVLYAESNSSKWRVQCVPESESSFVSRKPLPEPWRGIRDEQLSSMANIPGCVFVHASGFIGGAHSYESALAMAVAGLEAPSNKKQKVEA